MQCLMDHIVLNMEDDDKMISFYSKVLMLPTERLDEYRAGKVPFPSVRLNADTIIDLFPKKMWQKSTRVGEGRENLNHFCIALTQDTWQELLERLKANAVPIEEGPVPRWGAARDWNVGLFSGPGRQSHRGKVLRGAQQFGEMSPWIMKGQESYATFTIESFRQRRDSSSR